MQALIVHEMTFAEIFCSRVYDLKHTTNLRITPGSQKQEVSPLRKKKEAPATGVDGEAAGEEESDESDMGPKVLINED
jgi:hypothetical protein